MEQLQQKYYSNPPISRNSPTYFIPTHFANLIHSLDPTFEFSFHPELTFALYSGLKPLPSTQKYLDSIFNHSKSNQQLLFRYLQTFPPR